MISLKLISFPIKNIKMKLKRQAIKCKEILTIIKWANNYDLEYIRASMHRDLHSISCDKPKCKII